MQLPQHAETKGSSKADRIEVSMLMTIWARNKDEWRKCPFPTVFIDGFRFTISASHENQYIKIKCGKYTWVEDYFPVYISAQFGVKYYGPA